MGLGRVLLPTPPNPRALHLSLAVALGDLVLSGRTHSVPPAAPSLAAVRLQVSCPLTCSQACASAHGGLGTSPLYLLPHLTAVLGRGWGMWWVHPRSQGSFLPVSSGVQVLRGPGWFGQLRGAAGGQRAGLPGSVAQGRLRSGLPASGTGCLGITAPPSRASATTRACNELWWFCLLDSESEKPT